MKEANDNKALGKLEQKEQAIEKKIRDLQANIELKAGAYALKKMMKTPDIQKALRTSKEELRKAVKEKQKELKKKYTEQKVTPADINKIDAELTKLKQMYKALDHSKKGFTKLSDFHSYVPDSKSISDETKGRITLHDIFNNDKYKDLQPKIMQEQTALINEWMTSCNRC